MNRILFVISLSASLGCALAYGGYGGGYGGEISAAIISKHSIHSIPYGGGGGGNGRTTYVKVGGGVAPIKLHFQSRSSPIYMSHSHKGGGGSFAKSYSSDSPHVRMHVVTKPVIHKLTEIIAPYKYTKQIVKPVISSYDTSVYGDHY